jgi:hypothetical protein
MYCSSKPEEAMLQKKSRDEGFLVHVKIGEILERIIPCKL